MIDNERRGSEGNSTDPCDFGTTHRAMGQEKSQNLRLFTGEVPVVPVLSVAEISPTLPQPREGTPSASCSAAAVINKQARTGVTRRALHTVSLQQIAGNPRPLKAGFIDLCAELVDVPQLLLESCQLIQCITHLPLYLSIGFILRSNICCEQLRE